MIDHSIKCQECGAYGGGHAPFCGQQTQDEVKATLKQYYNAWLKGQQELHVRYSKWNKDIAFWQGKVRHLEA